MSTHRLVTDGRTLRKLGWRAGVTIGFIFALAVRLEAQDSQFTFDPNGNLLTESPATSLAPPQILSQPAPQVVAPGELASFFVIVADSRELTYQWRFNDANINGATNEALLLSNVGAANEGQYSVVLVNPSGSVTSASAALVLDSDFDRMGDSWELENFGNLNQNATRDFDNDGVSNLQEFLDDTSPTNSASALFRLTVLNDGVLVTANPARPSYTNGEMVTLTASDPFRAWTGDITTTNHTIMLTMTANRTVFAHAHSVELTWTNILAGDWNVATNWRPHLLPMSNDTVFITGQFTVTNNSLAECGSLILEGASTLTGSGTLVLYGDSFWLAGTMSGSGRTIVAPGATLAIANATDVTLRTRTLENAGTMLWTGRNIIVDGCVLTNRAGALFQVQNAAFFSAIPGFGSSRFDNAGTFRKTSAGTTTFDTTTAFNNYAAVEIQNGTLALRGGGRNESTMEFAAGATLNLGGVGYTTIAGSSLTGTGNLTVSGGTVNLAGLVNLEGTNAFSFSGGGTANLTGDYICTNNALIISGSATVNFSGTGSIMPATVTLNSGSFLTGSSVLTVLSEMIWSGGNMSGSGRTIIAPGATLYLNNPSTVSLNTRTLENGGTILWTGGGSLTMGSATITNRAGALFDMRTAATVNVSGANRFDNAGTFRKSVSAGTVNWPVTFNNSGLVEIETGRLTLSSGGTHSGMLEIAAGASLNLSFGTHVAGAASSISGAGDLIVSAGTATLAGLVNPSGEHLFTGGTANLNGNYVCTNNPATISGGTVNFNSTSAVPVVNFTSGTVGGSGVLNVLETMNWSGGNMDGSGRTVIAPGAVLNLNNGAFVTLNTRLLENAGTVLWTGAGNLTAHGTVITNRPGALFELRNNASLAPQGFVAWRFDNAGTFRKRMSAGTSTFAPGALFNNYGAVEIETGTLFHNAACTNQGTMSVAAGATLRLAGGGSASGSFAVPEAALAEWTGNVFTLNPGAQLNGAGLYRINGAGATLTCNANTAVAHLDFIAGTLGGTGVLTVNDVMNWTSGGMTGSGRTTIAPGATLNLNNGGAVTLDTRSLENGGTVIWTGAGNLTASATVITNRAGALFEVRNNASLAPRGFEAWRIDNAGTFRKAIATGTTTFASGTSFNNYNTVELRSGILAANGGYTSRSNSLLNCAIGGTNAGTGFGRLQVSGTVNLNGSLSVDFVNGFLPAANDSFTVVTAGTRSGTFADFVYPSNEVTMQLSNTPNSVIVRVTGLVTNLTGPMLLSPELAGSDIRLIWTATPNTTYRVEFKSDLNDTNWMILNGDITSSSNRASKLDALTPSNRFYRIQVLP